MGTNYYAQQDSCRHCGRCNKYDRYHIGKSSGGWNFSLHVKGPQEHAANHELPEGKFSCLEDWKHFLSAIAKAEHESLQRVKRQLFDQKELVKKLRKRNTLLEEQYEALQEDLVNLGKDYLNQT